MRIIDLAAFVGSLPCRPMNGEPEAVRRSLAAYGVSAIFVSPLAAAWCRNPHLPNQQVYEVAERYEDIWPVPVLDPTIATWRKELDRAGRHPKAHLIRLLPTYSPYELASATPLLKAGADAGLGVIVQTRLEDPRRQHPLAQVADTLASAVVDVAEKHSDLRVVIGGARTSELRALSGRIQELPNLYADVSQCDGLDAVKMLAENGLARKLVFGSHAPLFNPYSALARVAIDLDDATAAAILERNADRLLGWD